MTTTEQKKKLLKAKIAVALNDELGRVSKKEEIKNVFLLTPFSANTLCQLCGTLYKRAEIAGGSSHSGRRSFITKLAHGGVSAKVIMTLAGHKHLSTTQRYIDVNDEMLRKAVELA